MSKDTELPIVKAEEVVRTLFNSMANALADGDRVDIRGFGSLKVKHYDGYTGKTLRQANLSRASPRSFPSSNATKTSREGRYLLITTRGGDDETTEK